MVGIRVNSCDEFCVWNQLKEENQNLQAEIKANGESMKGMRDCIINLGGNLKELGGVYQPFLSSSILLYPFCILCSAIGTPVYKR